MYFYFDTRPNKQVVENYSKYSYFITDHFPFHTVIQNISLMWMKTSWWQVMGNWLHSCACIPQSAARNLTDCKVSVMHPTWFHLSAPHPCLAYTPTPWLNPHSVLVPSALTPVHWLVPVPLSKPWPLFSFSVLLAVSWVE